MAAGQSAGEQPVTARRAPAATTGVYVGCMWGAEYLEVRSAHTQTEQLRMQRSSSAVFFGVSRGLASNDVHVAALKPSQCRAYSSATKQLYACQT